MLLGSQLHCAQTLQGEAVSAVCLRGDRQREDLLTKPQVDEILDSQNLEPNLRAENLTVEQMIDLLEACRQKGLENKS